MKAKLIFLIFIFFIGCSNEDVIQMADTIKDAGDNYLNKDEVPQNDNTQELKDDDNISYTQEIENAIKRNNEIRSQMYAGYKLQWSTKLAIDAALYAEELSKTGAWEHDPKNSEGYTNSPYGENLYTSTKNSTLSDAINEWYKEKEYYDYGEIGDNSTCQAGQMCGHYTQLIWQDTSLFGCAKSIYQIGQYKDWYLIVCKYKTPGNYMGETPY